MQGNQPDTFRGKKTGELITAKVVRSVRRGAEGKGRNREPRQRPTQRKQGLHLLDALEVTFRGQPPLPSFKAS
jgi:hypothetical protein